MAVWLVISPTPLPRTRCRESRTSTSSPVSTRAWAAGAAPEPAGRGRESAAPSPCGGLALRHAAASVTASAAKRRIRVDWRCMGPAGKLASSGTVHARLRASRRPPGVPRTGAPALRKPGHGRASRLNGRRTEDGHTGRGPDLSETFRPARPDELEEVSRLQAHSFPAPGRGYAWWMEFLKDGPHGGLE